MMTEPELLAAIRAAINLNSIGGTDTHPQITADGLVGDISALIEQCRSKAIKTAANIVAGWTVSMNSKHLMGWGSNEMASQVSVMLMTRDAEIETAIRALIPIKTTGGAK